VSVTGGQTIPSIERVFGTSTRKVLFMSSHGLYLFNFALKEIVEGSGLSLNFLDMNVKEIDRIYEPEVAI
jgi:hypothetical protein